MGRILSDLNYCLERKQPVQHVNMGTTDRAGCDLMRKSAQEMDLHFFCPAALSRFTHWPTIFHSLLSQEKRKNLFSCLVFGSNHNWDTIYHGSTFILKTKTNIVVTWWTLRESGQLIDREQVGKKNRNERKYPQGTSTAFFPIHHPRSSTPIIIL